MSSSVLQLILGMFHFLWHWGKRNENYDHRSLVHANSSADIAGWVALLGSPPGDDARTQAPKLSSVMFTTARKCHWCVSYSYASWAVLLFQDAPISYRERKGDLG